MDDLEDIMDAGHNLDIRAFGIHEITAVREVHQLIAARILKQIGVVLVSEVTPEGVHGDVFTPFQLLDKGNTVEELSVQVP